MEDEIWKVLKKWMYENYRFGGQTSIYVKTSEENICFVEITVDAKNEEHLPMIGTYSGVCDDTFIPLAKVNIDAQLLQEAMKNTKPYNQRFLQMLN